MIHHTRNYHLLVPDYHTLKATLTETSLCLHRLYSLGALRWVSGTLATEAGRTDERARNNQVTQV